MFGGFISELGIQRRYLQPDLSRVNLEKKKGRSLWETQSTIDGRHNEELECIGNGVYSGTDRRQWRALGRDGLVDALGGCTFHKVYQGGERGKGVRGGKKSGWMLCYTFLQYEQSRAQPCTPPCLRLRCYQRVSRGSVFS